MFLRTYTEDAPLLTISCLQDIYRRCTISGEYGEYLTAENSSVFFGFPLFVRILLIYVPFSLKFKRYNEFNLINATLLLKLANNARDIHFRYTLCPGV